MIVFTCAHSSELAHPYRRWIDSFLSALAITSSSGIPIVLESACYYWYNNKIKTNHNDDFLKSKSKTSRSAALCGSSLQPPRASQCNGHHGNECNSIMHVAEITAPQRLLHNIVLFKTKTLSLFKAKTLSFFRTKTLSFSNI